MNKKGDLVSMQLILLILAIVGFAILLIFLYYTRQGYDVDKEACHQSVIFRATAGSTKDILDLPLKCKTAKVCFTTGLSGAECNAFLGEKNVQTVRVTDMEDLKGKIAGLIYDCWWMMGEGKVDVFSREFAATKTTEKCVICSRFDFDKNDENLQGKNLIGLYQYLEQTKMLNSDETYLDFLNGYRGARLQGKIDDEITLNQRSIIFIESGRTTAPETIASYAGAAIGLFATKSTYGVVGGGVIGYESGTFIGGLIAPKHAWNWVMKEYTVEDLKESKCSSFENLA